MNCKLLKYPAIPFLMAMVLSTSALGQDKNAVESDFTFSANIPVNATEMTIDELGFIYLVRDNKLLKMNDKGRVMFNYSNLGGGDISFLDASNPFKILLFFMTFGNIELLDNTLSPSNTISLSMFGLELSTLAAISYNNGFWLYHPQNLELIRIDQFLQITDRSGNIFKATGKNINPNFLMEKDDMLYMNDPENGIMLFDKYGAYYKTINVRGLDYFQVFDKKLIFFQSGKMIILDPSSMEEISFILPVRDYKKLAVSLGTEEKKLFGLREGHLDIYILNKSL